MDSEISVTRLTPALTGCVGIVFQLLLAWNQCLRTAYKPKGNCGIGELLFFLSCQPSGLRGLEPLAQTTQKTYTPIPKIWGISTLIIIMGVESRFWTPPENVPESPRFPLQNVPLPSSGRSFLRGVILFFF